MLAFVYPSGKPETCHPLTLSRTIAELPAGNRSVAELQSDAIERAGLEMVDNDTPRQERANSHAIILRSDTYVCPADLRGLADCEGEGILVDADDEPLAWRARGAAVPEDAPRIPTRCGVQIRYPWDLLRLNEIIVGALDHDELAGEVSDAAHIEGYLAVGEGTRILPGVFIEGNVVIGKNCKIGPNCYIRGKTSIGHNCHVGQAVEIKNSILMHGVSVGHLSYCGDTIIADNANLGAGTITANLRHDNADHRSMVGKELIDTGRRKLGAVIGENAHTGIHTSIYPGRKMWPGTATRPAEIVQKDVR